MEELHGYCFQMLEENRYLQLPSEFYELIDRQDHFASPQLLLWNSVLAGRLQVDVPETQRAKLFSGSRLIPGSRAFAMAYAGHQFGNFVPQLGDGRAMMLGQVRDQEGHVLDLHLKGSGPTRFSRRGDGMSALGPCLREYMISHWMKSLGVPTTETLAVVTTGEFVNRDQTWPGAVLTRVARSHVRVGTFEYFASRGDVKNLKLLFEFVVQDLYPELSCLDQDKEKVFRVFKVVLEKQVKTVSLWLKFGFIHGVMNTDNTSISGETIDYGPCAFMDQFHPDTVFSSIDRGGRYRYSQQADILFWNLSALASALLVLWPEDQRKSQVPRFEDILHQGYQEFQKIWAHEFSKKLGFETASPQGLALLDSFFALMQNEKMDFTKSFRRLGAILQGQQHEMSEAFAKWVLDWRSQIQDHNQALKLIETNSPVYIPRNHLVEKAIHDAVEQKDLSFFSQLFEVGRNPFVNQSADPIFESPPENPDPNYRTFCGT